MKEEEKLEIRQHLIKWVDTFLKYGIVPKVVNPKAIKANYILKSKVKDKIEEYQKTEKEMHENKNHSNDINEIYKYAVEEDKAKYGAIVLQKLLGEE